MLDMQRPPSAVLQVWGKRPKPVADDYRTVEPPHGFVDASDQELAFEMHRAHKFQYLDAVPNGPGLQVLGRS